MLCYSYFNCYGSGKQKSSLIFVLLENLLPKDTEVFFQKRGICYSLLSVRCWYFGFDWAYRKYWSLKFILHFSFFLERKKPAYVGKSKVVEKIITFFFTFDFKILHLEYHSKRQILRFIAGKFYCLIVADWDNFHGMVNYSQWCYISLCFKLDDDFASSLIIWGDCITSPCFLGTFFRRVLLKR